MGMSDPLTQAQNPQGTQNKNDDRAGAAVAPAVVSSIAQSPPVATQPQSHMSASGKEKGVPTQERNAPMEVAASAATIETEPIPEDVEAWMEKVGGESSQVSQDLPAVQVPPPAPTQTTPSVPVFVLPLGEQEMQIGLHAGVNDSIRWLATW